MDSFELLQRIKRILLPDGIAVLVGEYCGLLQATVLAVTSHLCPLAAPLRFAPPCSAPATTLLVGSIHPPFIGHGDIVHIVLDGPW